MADNQMRPTKTTPQEFLASVGHDKRRQDGQALLALMRDVTGEEPAMWGPSIIGFGHYHYVYESGREGDAPRVGFSPRRSNLALYGLTSAPQSRTLLAELGKHKMGASCLYINKLEDVDSAVLRALVEVGWQHDAAC